VVPQAIGGSAGGDEAKLPETDFVRDDPQWLADATAMTDDFMQTPAVDHLVQGRLGAPLNPSIFLLDDCQFGPCLAQLFWSLHSKLAAL
jgi:hypothetical protein